MYTVMITGPLGSGKSLVCEYLHARGAQVISLDEIASTVRLDPAVSQALAESFGEDVLDESGIPCAAVLAERAFASKDSLACLNRICFPPIIERLSHRLLNCDCQARAEEGLIALEVPLLPECPDLATLADEVVLVISSPETRLSRACARGMSADDAGRRMELQADESSYRALADTVFVNEGGVEGLYAALDAWWDERMTDGRFSVRDPA